MAEDARYRTKVFLEDLDGDNLVKDDGTTPAEYITAYGFPNYSLVRVFKEKRNDIVFSIGEPESKALLNTDQSPYGYEESVPILICTVNKTGITGTNIKWMAEAELRRLCEADQLLSHRSLLRRGDQDFRLGSITVYATEYVLSYVRDTT